MDDRKLLTVQRWAEIVILRWQERIAAFEIGDTGALARSFSAHVMADSKGDPLKVSFTFLYYGRFVDMGSGTGTRTKKPWFSSVFFREIEALGNLMATKYGFDAAQLCAFNGPTINYGQ